MKIADRLTGCPSNWRRYEVPLGRTGIAASPYCLGAMMFGAMGNRDHDDSIRIIHRALDVVRVDCQASLTIL
jgi:hypothetical protein